MFNKLSVTGRVISVPEYSHTSIRGIDIYKFKISLIRPSQKIDENVVTAPIHKTKNLKVGDFVRVTGSLHTRNLDSRLLVFIWADQILLTSEDDYLICFPNNYPVEGYICKKGDVRETPAGRKILDFFIAIQYGTYSCYIPCIAWENTCEHMSKIDIGTKVKVFGRLQSRDYQKKYDFGDVENRIAYEFSVGSFEIV